MRSILLLICVLLLSCEAYEPSELKDTVDDFSLIVSDTSGVRADGLSEITVTLKNTKEVRDDVKASFQTNKGSLLLSEVPFRANSASTRLRVAQDTGIYILKAQLKDGDKVIVEKTVMFSLQRAHADSIGLQVQRTYYSLKDPITIGTYLHRNYGMPTKGASVFFRAFQLGNTNADTLPVGRFEGIFNNYSNADGKLSDIKLFTDTPGIDTLKPVTIVASTLKDNGDSLRKYYSITYK